MILETERLYLRPLTKDDTESLAKMYADIEVMRFIGEGRTFNRAQAEKSIERWNEYEAQKGYCNWAIVRKEDNVYIGNCGFSRLPDDSDIEIAYLLDEPYWGKGYASEISKATLEYGFDKLNMNRIVALVYPQNSPSIRVIEKMGMKYEKEAEFWGVKLLMFAKEK